MSVLESIKDGSIGLAPVGSFTSVDPETGLVVLSVPSLSSALAAAIVSRYGTDAVAVRVDASLPILRTQVGRQQDQSSGGFYGGAHILDPDGSCSDAFAWHDFNGDYYVLSAGHCFPLGGGARTPVDTIGNVYNGSGETYDDNVGTVFMTGQTQYRGDMALIKVDKPKTSAGRIYRGGPNSTSSTAVGQMWSRSASTGDPYCTGAQVSGEICGWTVTGAGVDINIKDDYNRTVTERNVVLGSKGGACTASGDSGGSVFTVRSDGKIAAKGIHDAGGSLNGTCTEIFTDIYEAYRGFPGVLTTS